MVRKFKLIKEYPGSPKLGSIIMDTNPNNGAKDSWFEENWGKVDKLSFKLGISTEPEKYPEFWEEIKDKEYEVLKIKYNDSETYAELCVDGTYCYIGNIKKREGSSLEECLRTNWGIYSIKRLSDGEVFTVGDKITGASYNDVRVIKTIKLNPMCIGKGIYFEQSGGHTELEAAKKAKYPLFITEDKVEVFENDSVWLVKPSIEKFFIINWKKYFGDNGKPMPKDKAFSKEINAQKYIDESKPKYSKKDILNIIAKCTYGSIINGGIIINENSLINYLDNDKT